MENNIGIEEEQISYEPVVSLEEAIERADYYANIACRAVLTALESQYTIDKYTRKVVLDSVNDFKRNIVRFIYKVA